LTRGHGDTEIWSKDAINRKAVKVDSRKDVLRQMRDPDTIKGQRSQEK